MKTSNPHEEAFRSILELIGKRLYELRLAKGYKSHVDFANDHNLPSIQYWRIEKGRANITIKSLHKILLIHNINIEDLFDSSQRGPGLEIDKE
jgi:hypothetical protein